MDEKSEIVEVESPYQKLLEEVRVLKARLVVVISERDDLRDHICREIQAEYDEKVGKLELEAMEIEIRLKSRMMTLQFMQAAVNRDQEPSYEEAKRKTEEHTNQYYDDLNKKAEQAKKDEEYARRRRKQDEWNEQRAREDGSAGHGVDGNGSASGEKGNDNPDRKTAGPDGKTCGKGTDGTDKEQKSDDGPGKPEGQDDSRDGDDPDIKKMSPSQELKYLYRKIMKKLHPDSNPNATKEEYNMLLRAQQAFAEGDLVTLREISEKISEEDFEERFENTAEDIEKLMQYRDQLREQIWSAEHDIEDIKGTFPYNARDFLDDEDAVRERRAELINYIHECEEQIKELDERIDKLREEHENRQQKCS